MFLDGLRSLDEVEQGDEDCGQARRRLRPRAQGAATLADERSVVPALLTAQNASQRPDSDRSDSDER
jgi:hypothetical protein